MLDGLGLLPSVAYQPPQDGSQSNANTTRNHKKLHFANLASSTYSSDAEEDSFPTPRGLPQQSDATSWRESCSSFNSLYDVSDDDSEIVPLRLSNSVKKAVNKPVAQHNRPPSLIIPSPTAWPTIQKLKAKSTPAATLSPLKTPLSPQALAKLSLHNSLQVPGVNATPSLDGSLTSDEMASISSCTTPASYRAENEDQWDMPIQLDPHAMDTLLALDVDEAESVVEVTEAQAGEMQSQGRSMNDVILAAAQRNEEDAPASAVEPFSAISLPSPGGFFSTLDSPSKRVWTSSAPEDQGPTTSTAESFYGVPWSNDIAERYIDLASPRGTDGPPTARKDSYDSDVTTVDELIISESRQYEYDEQYEEKLHREATTNMSRTSLWLNQQDTYLSALKSSNPVNARDSQWPQAENSSMKSPTSILSPRKSVRFAAEPMPQTPQTAHRLPAALQKQKADPLFYHAFQHLLATNSVESAYTYRHVRAAALSTQRRYVADKHRSQLSCSYSLPSGTSVASARDFSHLPDGPASALDEGKRAAVQAADRERQALAQLSLSVWALLATRFLASGSSSLLSPPAAAILAANPAARVLDLGGQPTADWAWALALEHRDAKIHTVVLDAQTDIAGWKAHRGPRNHRISEVACAWELPFPDASFEIISARTLHTILRDNHGFDEWDATLAEVRRVLAPGGVFCYEAMDAEIAPLNTANAGVAPSQAQSSGQLGTAITARSAEFAVAVRQLGYSASAGQVMPQRLARAGFSASEISNGRRAWVSLPLSSGGAKVSQDSVSSNVSEVNEAGIEAVTSLAGSVAWERWMLKLQREMGRPEERLLDGVGKALDEAGSSGGWRMLRGWVRKE